MSATRALPLLIPRSPQSQLVPALQQCRYASTTRNPTPNQFAKNASAAYAKQQQPQYQPKQAAQKQKPQPARPEPRRQDVGADARIPQPGSGSLLYRLLTSLSSTFRLPAVSSTPPVDSAQSAGRGGAYSVYSPHTSRSKLRSDASAATNKHASVRQKLGYDNVARRVLLAMVAMPIVLVTSWVLFQRLVAGEEKKVFPVTPVGRGGDERRTGESGETMGDVTGLRIEDGVQRVEYAGRRGV